MSERLAVCQALAAVVRDHGELDEQEVTFVGMAATQLGLTGEENEQVQAVLKDGGDFGTFLSKIESKPMKAFFIRRLLAATLLDEHINVQEQAFIDKAAQQFGLQQPQVAELIAWMKVQIEVENRLSALLARI